MTVGKILQDFKAPPVIHYLNLDMEKSEYLVLLTFPFDVWVHPTLPELARKLKKYGKREPSRDDFMSQSADTARKCRQMSESLAQGLLKGCCRPNLQSTDQGARGDNAERGGGDNAERSGG